MPRPNSSPGKRQTKHARSQHSGRGSERNANAWDSANDNAPQPAATPEPPPVAKPPSTKNSAPKLAVPGVNPATVAAMLQRRQKPQATPPTPDTPPDTSAEQRQAPSPPQRPPAPRPAAAQLISRRQESAHSAARPARSSTTPKDVPDRTPPVALSIVRRLMPRSDEEEAWWADRSARLADALSRLVSDGCFRSIPPRRMAAELILAQCPAGTVRATEKRFANALTIGARPADETPLARVTGPGVSPQYSEGEGLPYAPLNAQVRLDYTSAAREMAGVQATAQGLTYQSEGPLPSLTVAESLQPVPLAVRQARHGAILEEIESAIPAGTTMPLGAPEFNRIAID